MLIYSCSPTLSQISLKKSFGKVVLQILAKIEMTRNKNRLFGRSFETVQHFHFHFVFQNCDFFIVHTYTGANFIAKFRWESGFLIPPPRAPTGVKVPWSRKC